MTNSNELTPSQAIGVDLSGFAEQILVIVADGLAKMGATDTEAEYDQLHAQTLESISGTAFGLCVVAREHALVGALRSIAACQAIQTPEDAEAVLEAHRTRTGGIVENPDGTVEFRPK